MQCEQAIFTSVRTPMGEGYRIIAAGKGLKPEEKKTITTQSPSHEAVCDTSPDARAVACYPLPTERLCVAATRVAGAEQSGRGGRRVYTMNIIFDVGDFEAFGYNPFHVARAMETAGLTEPQLKPPAVLPDVDIEIDRAQGHHQRI
ncbi:MAG: hypothetical protein ACE5E6_02550, partial [Phycisphaerae bacterium]